MYFDEPKEKGRPFNARERTRRGGRWSDSLRYQYDTCVNYTPISTLGPNRHSSLAL